MANASKSKRGLIGAIVTRHSASPDDVRPACAVYSRSSTDKGDPTKSIGDLKRAAEQRGYFVALEVTEIASGKRNDRPGMHEVIAAASRAEVAAVLVTRLDRWGRSAVDLQSNIKILTDCGCRFMCSEQAGIDVQPNGDPIGTLILGILAQVAQFERDIIVSRVREGQKRAMKRGVRFGRKLSPGPSPDEVRRLREAKRSWSQIAEKYKCTVGLARRRFAEAE